MDVEFMISDTFEVRIVAWMMMSYECADRKGKALRPKHVLYKSFEELAPVVDDMLATNMQAGTSKPLILSGMWVVAS
jgi:hypothetical protein